MGQAEELFAVFEVEVERFGGFTRLATGFYLGADDAFELAGELFDLVISRCLEVGVSAAIVAQIGNNDR